MSGAQLTQLPTDTYLGLLEASVGSSTCICCTYHCCLCPGSLATDTLPFAFWWGLTNRKLGVQLGMLTHVPAHDPVVWAPDSKVVPVSPVLCVMLASKKQEEGAPRPVPGGQLQARPTATSLGSFLLCAFGQSSLRATSFKVCFTCTRRGQAHAAEEACRRGDTVAAACGSDSLAPSALRSRLPSSYMQNGLATHPGPQSLSTLQHQLKMQDLVIRLGPGEDEAPQEQPLRSGSSYEDLCETGDLPPHTTLKWGHG